MAEWQKIKDLPTIAEQLKIAKIPPPPPSVFKTEVSGYLKVTTEKAKKLFVKSYTKRMVCDSYLGTSEK